MTHIGIEFGSNEIRAVRLSRDHSHVEAFIDRPLNAPPSGFAFSETLRSTLADLGLTPGDPLAIAVAIGRSGSGISSDSGISDFLDELGNRLGEPLVQVADRLGRVAYAPAPSLALVQSAFADTGFAVESIELPPVAAARLVPDGSPGVLRLHSGVDWAARIVGGQLVEALAAPIRESTEGVLWHPSAGHSQLITDFPVGCDLPGRDRPAAGVAIGAAIGLSRSTRPLQLNRDAVGVEEAALALAARAPSTAAVVDAPRAPRSDSFRQTAAPRAATVAPAVVDDAPTVDAFDAPSPKSLTRTGRRAAKKAAIDPAPPSPPAAPAARADKSTVPVGPDGPDDEAAPSPTPQTASPRVEDTAAAEEMIARARSRAKESDADAAAGAPASADGRVVEAAATGSAPDLDEETGSAPAAKKGKKAKRSKKARAREAKASEAESSDSDAEPSAADAKDPAAAVAESDAAAMADGRAKAGADNTATDSDDATNVSADDAGKTSDAQKTKTDDGKTEVTTKADATAKADGGTTKAPAKTDEAAKTDAPAKTDEAAKTDAPAKTDEASSPVTDGETGEADEGQADSAASDDSQDDAAGAEAKPDPVTPPAPTGRPPAPAPAPRRTRNPLGAAPIGRIGQRSPKRPLFDIPPLDDGTSGPAPLPAAEPVVPAPAARTTEPAVDTDVAASPTANGTTETKTPPTPTPDRAKPAAKEKKGGAAPSEARKPDAPKGGSPTEAATKADDRQALASSSLTQRLRDDQAQQRDTPESTPRDATPGRRSKSDKATERPAVARADDVEAPPKRSSDRSHLSVARSAGDLRRPRPGDRDSFDDDAFDDDARDEDSFARDIIDRDVAELAGFGAALAEDDDFDDDFESSEFDSGDLSIDEILAEGRRREASYAAAAQPLRARDLVTEEDIQTQRALDSEREREVTAVAELAERQREADTAPRLRSGDEVDPITDRSGRVPGGFLAEATKPKPATDRLRALPQPRQDDRVRPPEAAQATPPAPPRQGLPLPLMALFALLSVTALVLVAIGFDNPPDRTTTTDAAPTTTATDASETNDAETTTAPAAPEPDDEIEPTTVSEEAGAEVEATPAPTAVGRPAVSLDDLGPHEVTMADGVITLEGPLPNQEILDLFAERATTAVGEANVVNNMVVHPDAPPPANGNVRVESAVVFTTGGAEIPTQYAATINQTVALMQLYPSVTLVIEGHSDSDGTPEQNVRFSENRANAIVAWLAASGISPDRMSIVGYGDARPVATNETDEGKAANRRVDLEYVDLLSG